MTDDTNITPESGDPNGISRGQLRLIQGGEQIAGPVSGNAPAADSMRGLSFEEMLLADSERVSPTAPAPVGGATEEREPGEPQPGLRTAPEIDTAAMVEHIGDLSAPDDFELPYSDGSTTPAYPPSRSVIRRRSRSEAQAVDQARLAQALEDTTADVWAAHRDESWPTEGTHTWNAAAEPKPRRGGGSRRGLVFLALISITVVILGAGVLLDLSSGGTPKPSFTHKPTTPRVTQTVAQAVSTPAVTTSVKIVVKKRHKKRVVHHRKARTHVASTTPTTATTTPFATPVTETTAPVSDKTSTGAAKSTTPATTTTSSTSSTPTNNESPGGALPGVQQTQQAP